MPYEPVGAAAHVGDVLLFHNDDGFFTVNWFIQHIDGTEWNHSAHVYADDVVAQSEPSTGVGSVALQPRLDDAAYVGVLRLRSHPEDFSPLTARTQWYLARHDRYDYEAIVLLALLCLTRQWSLPFGAGRLLRFFLDGAASFLLDLEDRAKEPLICSALTYKCYNEAIPDQDDDAFTIVSNVNLAAVSPAVSTFGARGILRGRGVDPRSILGRLLRQPERILRESAPVTELRRSTADAAPLTFDARDARFQELLAAAAAAGESGSVTSDQFLADPASRDSIDRFVHSVAVIRGRAPAGEMILSNSLYLMSSYSAVAAEADHFVTPGDISKAPELEQVATYRH
ncbi:MAG: hypothetical protein ABI442_12850 [Gemmatimonadaceae bacterium]